ncbi:hypothetical protein SADUNF_Sadunf17G0085100 [Salix dunnii]|uniref:Uncharacterized protein n=1 Tax=Salix dunnii TaxID=1413687 RepID=A0A835MF12_9ROSI|nr:hypothetical protein SADUNF_Sadunf17G0085100 [Salix dunnii]
MFIIFLYKHKTLLSVHPATLSKSNSILHPDTENEIDFFFQVTLFVHTDPLNILEHRNACSSRW